MDGSKIRASASRHRAMSYDRIVPKIDQLQAEVDALLAEAEAVDEAEDQQFGEDRRGDEVAPELARREGRLAKLRAARDAIEADAAERARRRHGQNVGAATDLGVSGAQSTAQGALDLAAVAQDLHRRDTSDANRTHAPLQAAADAVVLDSSSLELTETVARVLELAAARGIS